MLWHLRRRLFFSNLLPLSTGSETGDDRPITPAFVPHISVWCWLGARKVATRRGPQHGDQGHRAVSPPLDHRIRSHKALTTAGGLTAAQHAQEDRKGVHAGRIPGLCGRSKLCQKAPRRSDAISGWTRALLLGRFHPATGASLATLLSGPSAAIAFAAGERRRSKLLSAL
jgi:hypothetical protein